MNQQRKDIKILETALAAGPSRYEQLVPDIYEIYHRLGYNTYTVSPKQVLDKIRINARLKDHS
jgi:hypothetical protein